MKYLVVMFLLLAAPCFAAATKVHNLGAAESAIKTPEGRRGFAEQIEGKTDTAPLGTTLPAGLSRDAIIRLVAPEANPSLITLVGAKPWSPLANGYVAIVCAARDADDKKIDEGTPGQLCDFHPTVFLGVITLAPGATGAVLVARTKPGFAMTSVWSPPAGAAVRVPTVAPSDNETDGAPDDEIVGFDLAPYRITPNDFAFGVRSDKTEGYSGGYATFETLHLFVVAGTDLRRILAQPIYGFAMNAGDWRKDGTRDHTIREAKLIVEIAPSMTDGHYNLVVKQPGQRGASVLHWNAAAGVYWVPGGKP